MRKSKKRVSRSLPPSDHLTSVPASNRSRTFQMVSEICQKIYRTKRLGQKRGNRLQLKRWMAQIKARTNPLNYSVPPIFKTIPQMWRISRQSSQNPPRKFRKLCLGLIKSWRLPLNRTRELKSTTWSKVVFLMTLTSKPWTRYLKRSWSIFMITNHTMNIISYSRRFYLQSIHPFNQNYGYKKSIKTINIKIWP